jgi:hypothetical protein
MSNAITRLKVDDEEFLVASIIDRCPKTMMLRELVQNAIEAASAAPAGRRRVSIGVLHADGVAKLRISNTGPGMDEPTLYRMCDIAASIGKTKGLDGNFGMGAKVASLPSNNLGVRYRSCAGGRVHEVILGKRDGIYGRLQRPQPGASYLPGVSRLVDIADVTEEVMAEGYDLWEDWTEVVLYGMRADHDTSVDPYDGDPAMPAFWLPQALYQRFFRIPAGVEIQIDPGLHWLSGTRRFEPVSARAATAFARYEAVEATDGIVVHFLHDPAHPERPWENQSSDEAMQSSAAQVAIVHRNEIYDVYAGSPWAYDAPLYGITFGARHISVYIELPEGYPVLADTYRQFLRYHGSDQRHVMSRDFAQLVCDHRPAWVLEVMEAIGGKSSTDVSVLDDLGSLTHELGIDKMSSGGEEGPAPEADSGADGAGKSMPKGRSICGFDIVLLRNVDDIRDRWLLGRAACFYPETKQLFINTHYPSLLKLQDKLRSRLNGRTAAPDLETSIIEVSEDCLVRRIGRGLIFAIAKHLEPEIWQQGHIEKAMAPESLSILADGLEDSLSAAEKEILDRLNHRLDRVA